MSYDAYQGWLRGLNDKDLNAELMKMRDQRNAARNKGKAFQAWDKMYEAAVAEQSRRDHVAMSDVNKFLDA